MEKKQEKKFMPNKKSLSKHQIPSWFEDAKFGIFIHWGLFSVPAFATPVKKNHFHDFAKTPEERHKNNPYAEWYLNSLKIEGSSTQVYHKKTYGENFSYDEFAPMFNEAIKRWDPEVMAELFKTVHAKYVVLVTKHHDGFTLWPSNYPNPNKKNYHAIRNIVGELTAAVKKRSMTMGLYYSGLLDWTFKHDTTIAATLAEDVLGKNTDKEYIKYANNHWYELIDTFEPKILWNDIGYPTRTNINEIFAYFYNKIPDGVVDDRWMQIKIWMIKALKIKFIRNIVNKVAKRYEGKPAPKFIAGRLKFHHDFLTPEYNTFDTIVEKKWEANRGIGNSFGYNKFETEENYMSVQDLIRLFVDIVSKNGNLLLNVGPMADGTIPEIQKKVLERFGKWLDVNGEAIFATRPWMRAEGTTSEGLSLRFTKKASNLFVIVLDPPKSNSLTILDLIALSNVQITLLGREDPLKWEQKGSNLIITLPNLDPETYAISLKLQNFQRA